MCPEFRVKMSTDGESTRKRKPSESPKIERKIRSESSSDTLSSVSSSSSSSSSKNHHLSAANSEHNTECVNKSSRNKPSECSKRTTTGSASKDKPAAAATSGAARSTPEVNPILRRNPRVILIREPLIEQGLKSGSHKAFSCRVRSPETTRTENSKKPETASFPLSEPEVTAAASPKSGNRVKPKVTDSTSTPEIKGTSFSKPETGKPGPEVDNTSPEMNNPLPEVDNPLLFEPETTPASESGAMETAKPVVVNAKSSKFFKPSRQKIPTVSSLKLDTGNSLTFDLKPTIPLCGPSKSKMHDKAVPFPQARMVTPGSFPKVTNMSADSSVPNFSPPQVARVQAPINCSIPTSRLLKRVSSCFNSIDNVVPHSVPSLTTSSNILNQSPFCHSLLSPKTQVPTSGHLPVAPTLPLLSPNGQSSKDAKQNPSVDSVVRSEVTESPTSSVQSLTPVSVPIAVAGAPFISNFAKPSLAAHCFSQDTAKSTPACLEILGQDSWQKEYDTGVLLSNDPRRVIRNSLLQPTDKARGRIFQHVLRKFLINWTEKSRRIKRIGDKKDDECSCDDVIDSADLMTTDVPYYTITGCVPPDILNEKEITTDKLEIPSWRHKIFTSCYSMEGTENLSDDVFEKRHARLEQEEKRRKRWDVQRIREQRQLDHLRENERKRNWLAKSDDESDKERQRLCSLYPTVSSDTRISIDESLPVNALGVVLKRIEPREFSLPWKDGNTSCGFSYDKDTCPPKTRRK